MNKKILDYYLQFSLFTNPGLYQKILKKDLPNDVREIGLLVRKQIIHRSVLKNGNVETNKDLRYGDTTKVPWFRKCEDDYLPTASAMLSELYRRDDKGFILNMAEKNRLILTCRFVSILMSSILKTKGIPTRVRSGFAPYFRVRGSKTGISYDHWINQYWNKKEKKWVTIDVDGSLEDYVDFDMYNIQENTFDFPADAWLKIRRGELNPKRFWNAGGFGGLMVVSWALFHDFHCLMNNEITYNQTAQIVYSRFNKLSEKELREIDNLAELMLDPDKNFDKLQKVWETNKNFRLLKGGFL